MKKMTQSDIKSIIFNNPNPIFDEELEFVDYIELTVIRNKTVKFNKKTVFSHGARFQGVELIFNGAVFHESLEIENVSNIQFINCHFNNIKVTDCPKVFLNFRNCEINAIYFERTRHSEDLTFESTIINEFKSLESDFSRLQFISSIKNITIGRLVITGKTINSLEFINVECGNKSDNSSEYVSLKLDSKISKVIFQDTITYNNIDFHGEINTINFVSKPIFHFLNIYGKVEFINFNNQVVIKKLLNITGIIGKLLQISPTSKIKECKFDGAEINKFEISGGEIGLVNFFKVKAFSEKITITGGNIGEITIATKLNNQLEIRPEESVQIGVFNQFEFSEVTINDIDDLLTILNINLIDFVFPKDKTSYFSGFKINSLNFIDFYNYGNISFSNLNDGLPIIGNLQIRNSDLGKMLFMNCDFTGCEMDFVSSKISEIFLAGTSMPSSTKINSSVEPKGIDFENKRLALTQLKKVFDNRGDSLNSTKFHKAELEVWENELHRQEDEEKGAIINNHNWLKKIKLKIFNWISIKLFPEYCNLSIQDLEHKKLIYSQYKKMYESRGDAVKAIEYQGKELDVHRTILFKVGGQYWERFQLSLNKYSNNFGQSWQWAVCWIIGLGIFIYIFYCRSLGFTLGSGKPNEIETFKTLFSYFFEFINPIRKGEFIKLDGDNYYPISNSARVIDFIWRIVITYLGYQLIQAFRKYSKKTS